MNTNHFLEIGNVPVDATDRAIPKALNILSAIGNQFIEIGESTIILTLIGLYVALMTYKINTRSTMVSERVEERDIKIKRMNDLIELINLLLKYRELLENTTSPFSDSNRAYDIITLFDHEFHDDIRAKEINKMHSVIVRKKDDYKKSLIFSYRGEYEVEPLSISIYRDPGLKSISSDWDELFDALKSSINMAVNFSDISNALDELSRSSAESISEEFHNNGVARGNTSMATAEGRRLKNAILSIDINEFKRAVEQVTDINARDVKGRTFLHYAAGDGFWHVTKIVRFSKISGDEYGIQQLYEMYSKLEHITRNLIDAGADINARDNAGVPVIALASNVGNFRAIDILALGGADIEASIESSNLNALQVAAARKDYYTVNVLISRGANVNVKNSKNETPLHQVLIGKGDFNLVKILIEGGSNIDARDTSEVSPRDLIMDSDNNQLIDLIGDL